MLSINISELIWGIINFVLLYFLLKRFLFKPLLGFMDNRNARIRQGLEAKEMALAAEEKQADGLRAVREEGRTRAVKLIEAAAEEDKRLERELVANARAGAAEELERFDAGAEELCEEIWRQLEAERKTLAHKLSERILRG